MADLVFRLIFQGT